MEKSIFTAYYPILTKKLGELREAAGLTQRQLAKRWKTEQTTIDRLEHGQRRLDFIEFYLLCKALRVDPVKVATEILKKCQALDRQRR